MTHKKSAYVEILGVRFFRGAAAEAVKQMRCGGLLVAPAAPGLLMIGEDASYREALLNSDVAITDSAFMVIVWNRIKGDKLKRLSGLEYLRMLLQEDDVRTSGGCFWVMATTASCKRNLAYLEKEGITVPDNCVYVAPKYKSPIVDTELLAKIELAKPKHIVITVGGGVQEVLGLYLKRNLSFGPAIHCIGAAIAFLSGDQVNIPTYVDRLYLGWLLRSISKPAQYAPRYWEARKLFRLMARYQSKLPDC